MAGKELRGCERFVDMWALPGVHASNVELLQRLKTADTNHFTKNMDCVGTVNTLDQETGDWEKTHLVGLRTDIWKPDDEEMHSCLEAMKDKRRNEVKRSIKRSGRLNDKQKQRLENELADDDIMEMQSGDIQARRLVLKLFRTTGESTRWCGTIEEITATEVHNSIGTGKTLLTMAVMLARSEYVTYVQQNHRTFRIPSIFSFCYHSDDQMWNIVMRRHWFSIGADFEVEADGQGIGEIDGKLFSFGSDSHLVFDPHPLVQQRSFMNLVTLFAASVGYHKAMRRSVDRRIEAALEGNSHRNVLQSEELRLRQNGRAAA
ncbi:hypothetical protein [Roseiconus lacunae]|uniref:SNF2 N-terminal domain-containing protein n=1 Tax=Roseiconus lacunae TaxID=2605694 RepID=A0ABT7PR68_9BACT|nr:hypothetical protein [Roseiconus lacunae]MCD0459192.1 hypothetical protein [Roseiconus lacunae]MDM4019004.1 hypothetical protein [Roseiconus lacunae]WRQ51808.1 hypothetical protein U8335_04535 [Stieleria sp. HD01]